MLGVKPMRKCGSRSNHGPGRPRWAVQCTGSAPGTGWRSPVAARAPKRSAGPRSGPRLLTQSWPAVSPQRVNTLTL